MTRDPWEPPADEAEAVEYGPDASPCVAVTVLVTWFFLAIIAMNVGRWAGKAFWQGWAN